MRGKRKLALWGLLVVGLAVVSICTFLVVAHAQLPLELGYAWQRAGGGGRGTPWRASSDSSVGVAHKARAAATPGMPMIGQLGGAALQAPTLPEGAAALVGGSDGAAAAAERAALPNAALVIISHDRAEYLRQTLGAVLALEDVSCARRNATQRHAPRCEREHARATQRNATRRNATQRNAHSKTNANAWQRVRCAPVHLYAQSLPPPSRGLVRPPRLCPPLSLSAHLTARPLARRPSPPPASRARGAGW
jgi:hypothetical protein